MKRTKKSQSDRPEKAIVRHQLGLRARRCHPQLGLYPLSGVLLALFCGLADAAPPDAGSLLQDIRPLPPSRQSTSDALPEEVTRPAAQLNDSIPVTVRGFRILGASTFSDSDLQPLLKSGIGQSLTLARIHALAQNITTHYRQAGYPLARAYLPAQEIRDGIVEIAILEGRLGQRSVSNQSRLNDQRVVAYLDNLPEGEAVRGDVLERDLLLLSDLPGVEVKSTLRPGASVGTTDLDVQLKEKARYAGNLQLDNNGNRYSGEWRASAQFAIGNFAGLSDTLAVHILGAQGMGYGRLAWQVPVGSRGTQLGAAWSEMRYWLGSSLEDLNAHGTAQMSSLYLVHPFIRRRTNNLNGQISLDNKQLSDDIDSSGTNTRKHIQVINAGLSQDVKDSLLGGGLTSWSLALTAGHLKLDDNNMAIDQASYRSAGGYNKISLSAARTQQLGDPWSLYGTLKSQQSGKNLDSSEKMSLGGAQGVRAYPQDEASSDDAVLGSIELRRTVMNDWQASLFYDKARGSVSHHPTAADSNNVRRLAGYGLGLAYTTRDTQAQLTLAWRDGPQPTSDAERSPRVWFRLVHLY
jgi:hemolysin activation/secretion protein